MNIFFDNNVWDYLYSKYVDIATYFPKSKYSLYITTHGKYEILQMPLRCNGLRGYVEKALISLVREDAIFGYYNDFFPVEQQRLSGYDVGRYISSSELLLKRELFKKYGSTEKRKNSQILFKQEADIELASRSIEHTILTFDCKKGPLLDAKNRGGKIIFLDRVKSEKLPVEMFMKEVISLIDTE